MSLAGAYTNQSVTWHQRSGRDGDGQSTYTTSTINARWETKHRLIRLPSGKEVASSGLCITTAAVEVDDMLTAPSGQTFVVLSVAIIPGLDGSELHREVMV